MADLDDQTGYDPVAHLPAGRLLTTEILDGLIAAFEASGHQPLSEAAIAAIAGPPLPEPAPLKLLPSQEAARVTGFRQ